MRSCPRPTRDETPPTTGPASQPMPLVMSVESPAPARSPASRLPRPFIGRAVAYRNRSERGTREPTASAESSTVPINASTARLSGSASVGHAATIFAKSRSITATSAPRFKQRHLGDSAGCSRLKNVGRALFSSPHSKQQAGGLKDRSPFFDRPLRGQLQAVGEVQATRIVRVMNRDKVRARQSDRQIDPTVASSRVVVVRSHDPAFRVVQRQR